MTIPPHRSVNRACDTTASSVNRYTIRTPDFMKNRVVERKRAPLPRQENYWESFLREHEARRLLPQETKANPDQLTPPPLPFDGNRTIPTFFLRARSKKGYSGVALYSKSGAAQGDYGMGITEFDPRSPYWREYEDFWLINAYFPNGGQGPVRLDYKLRFYDAFLKFIEETAPGEARHLLRRCEHGPRSRLGAA